MATDDRQLRIDTLEVRSDVPDGSPGESGGLREQLMQRGFQAVEPQQLHPGERAEELGQEILRDAAQEIHDVTGMAVGQVDATDDPLREIKRQFDARGFQAVERPTADIGESSLEGVGVAARRGVGAFTQMAPLIPGMQMGAQIGTVALPFAPGVGTALGATAGLGAGYLFGDGLAHILRDLGIAETDNEQVDPHLRPWAVYGEVLGSAVPFSGYPLLAARMGWRLPSSWPGDYINRIIDTAGRTPLSFSAIELAAAQGAGVAGAFAEAAWPSNMYARFLSEMAGGFLSPVVLESRLVRWGMNALKNLSVRFTERGRMSKGGEMILNALQQHQEDPELLMRMIREGVMEEFGIAGPELTAAQITGSQAMGDVEKTLSMMNREYASQSARQYEQAMEATAAAIEALKSTGDPQALKMAAQLRTAQFETMLENEIYHAERQMREAAEQITRDAPRARAELSKQAEAILSQTLERVKRVENELWEAIPNLPIKSDGVDNVLKQFSLNKAEILERRELDRVMEGTIADLIASKAVKQQMEIGGPVDPKAAEDAIRRFSTKNLVLLRKEFGRLNRELADTKPNDARIYGELSEAVLRDLDRAFPTAEADSAYDLARRWTAAMHDVFTRTFVGRLDDTGRRGQQILDPEMLMKRAFATGEEAAELQFREMEEATRFLIDRGRGTDIDAQQLDTMLGVQERMLRLVASQAVERDPVTNVITGVNAKKARDLLTKNAELFDRFPEARQHLEAAIQTDAGRRAMIDRVNNVRSDVRQFGVLQDLLNVESPVDVVRGALAAKNPSGRFAALASIARTRGEEGLQALRAATIESAFDAARIRKDHVNLQALVDALNEPLRPGSPSAMRLMRQNGVINDREMGLLQRFLDRGQRIIDAAQARGIDPAQLTDEVDSVMETAFAVIGSRMGRLSAERLRGLLPGHRAGSAGESLIAAQRGSSAARMLFGKVPSLKVQNLMIAAVRGDPIRPGAPRFSLLEEMLNRAQSPAAAEASLRQVHAFMIANLTRMSGYLLEGESEGMEP